MLLVFNSWLVYDDSNYSGYANLFSESNISCLQLSREGSVRNVGHPTDVSISTLSLFGSTLLTSNMTQYTTNVPNYNGQFSSFLVTLPGEVTIYTAPNYQGLSLCLKPKTSDNFHWTLDIADLGIEPGDIKSIKLGCDSKNIRYSSPSTFPVFTGTSKHEN